MYCFFSSTPTPTPGAPRICHFQLVKHLYPYTRSSVLLCRPVGSNFTVWGASFSVFRKARRKQFQVRGGGVSFSVFRKSNCTILGLFVLMPLYRNQRQTGGGGQFPVSDHFLKQCTVKFNKKNGRPGPPHPSYGPAIIQKTTGAGP